MPCEWTRIASCWQSEILKDSQRVSGYQNLGGTSDRSQQGLSEPDFWLEVKHTNETTKSQTRIQRMDRRVYLNSVKVSRKLKLCVRWHNSPMKIRSKSFGIYRCRNCTSKFVLTSSTFMKLRKKISIQLSNNWEIECCKYSTRWMLLKKQWKLLHKKFPKQ